MDTLKKYIREFENSVGELQGFSIIVGGTPRTVKYSKPMNMTVAAISEEGMSVYNQKIISNLEQEIAERLGLGLHPYYINTRGRLVSRDELDELKKQFTNLGYEVESSEVAGYWCWLSVKCDSAAIQQHIEILKGIV